MITVGFSEQEAMVLQQLLDIATKAGGLQVAEAALVLSKRIAAAIEQSKHTAGNAPE